LIVVDSHFQVNFKLLYNYTPKKSSWFRLLYQLLQPKMISIVSNTKLIKLEKNMYPTNKTYAFTVRKW